MYLALRLEERDTHLSFEHEITGPSRHSRTRGSTLSGGRQHILFEKLDT